MNLYIPNASFMFCSGFAAGWFSLIGLVYVVATVQRRRNRRPQ